MLTLITAKPGSGKTQYAIERFVLDVIRDNEKEIADFKPTPEAPEPPLRRQVFTNIKGLDIGAIHALVGGKPVMPAPNDWRECPDGSVVIYDEAQQEHLFPATGKPGLPDDQRIARLDTHRHRGFDIVLITQDQALVHHWARKFVNCHLHLSRPSGAELMTIHQWTQVKSDPDDFFAKRDADTHTRRMSPATWKLYQSATVHTHKFKMPQGAKYAIRMFLVVAVVLAAGFAWLGFRGVSAAEPVRSPTVSQVESSPASGMLSGLVSQPVAPPAALNGCAVGRHCRCWDFDGKLMDIPDHRCRNLAEGIDPMPIDLNRFMQASGGRVGEGAGKSVAPAPPAASFSGPVGVSTPLGSVGSPAQGVVQGQSPVTLRASGG